MHISGEPPIVILEVTVMKKILYPICMALMALTLPALCACAGAEAREESASITPVPGGDVIVAENVTLEIAPDPEEPVPLTKAPASATGASASADPEDFAAYLDRSWEDLNAQGLLVTENGTVYAQAVVPQDYTGEVTQDGLDAEAGESYTSATLLEDGSIIYRMTEEQREKTLLNLAARFDGEIAGMVSSGRYTFTAIKHNADFSEFDVFLSVDEVGTEEYYAVLDLYAFGEAFSLYAGCEGERYVVRFYGTDGNLLTTFDSSEMV